MQNSTSFQTLLQTALTQNDSSNIYDIICMSLDRNLFLDASRLIVKSKTKFTEIYKKLNIIFKNLTRNNANGFNVFLLTLIIQGYRLDAFNFIIPDPVSDSNLCLEYALLISIPLIRISKNNQLAYHHIAKQFFTDNNILLKKRHSLAIKIIQAQLLILLKENVSKFKIKQSRPNNEFLFEQERNDLRDLSNELIKLANNYSRNGDEADFYNGCDNLFNQKAEILEKISTKGNNHHYSLIAKETGMLFINAIKKAENNINLFIESAIANKEFNLQDVLNQIQNYILKTTVLDQHEAYLIAELIGIIKQEIKRPGRTNFGDLLNEIKTNISNFEEYFRNKKGEYEDFYNYCIYYPSQRVDNLNNTKTDTFNKLILFGNTLKYIDYISKSSLIQSIIHFESALIALKYSSSKTPSIEFYQKKCNLRYHNNLKLMTLLRKIINKFKTFPHINVQSKDFVFKDPFQRFAFDSNLNMENTSVEDIDLLYQQKVDLVQYIDQAICANRVITKCLLCHTLFSRVICKKCKKFVLCQKCINVCHNCPVCGNPLPPPI